MAEAHQSENQSGKEVEIELVTKFLQSLDAVLSENRDALAILPEFLRKRVDELEANSTQNARTFTADNTGDVLTQEDKMEKRIISLEEELKGANQKIEVLQTKNKKNDNDVEMLKGRHRSQSNENYYKSKFKDLKANLRVKDEELKAKQDRIAELERELGSKQDEYYKEAEQNRQKFAEKDGILIEQKKEIRGLKEEHKKTLEEQRTRLHQLEARVAELNRELTSKEDVLIEQTRRHEKELGESEKAQSDVNIYRSILKDLEAKSTATEEELKAKEERIAELERELGSKQDENYKETEQNRLKFAEKDNILIEQKKEIRGLKEEHKKALEEQRTRLHQLEARVAELDQELASKEDVLREQTLRHEKELGESEKALRSEKLDRERAKRHHVDDLRDREVKMRSLEARCEQISANAERSRTELRHYIESFRRIEETYKSDLSLKEMDLSKTKERLSNREKEVKSLKHDVQRYKSRLASMCEKRVNLDQRGVENVLSSNKPSEVESDFKDFFDSDREDARDVIQSIYESDEKVDVRLYYPRIVCTILVAAYEVTKNVKEAVVDLFKESTKKMVLQAPEVGRYFNLIRMDDNFVFYPISIDVCDKSEKSSDVVDALLNSLKESAHTCNLECLEKDVSEFAWKIWSEWYEESSSFTLAPSLKVLTELRGYIRACVRLTWRMVTQLPPLRLEYNSSAFDHCIHRKFLYFISSKENQADGDTSVEEIACYLWPGLFDGGRKLICPGLVLCKMQQNK